MSIGVRTAASIAFPILTCALACAFVLAPYFDGRPYHQHWHRHHYGPSSQPFSENVTSPALNISITVRGACSHPITHVGFDNRHTVLRDYDVHALPRGHYRPATLNWARVLLLQRVIERCAGLSDWVLYSDTDAYVSHPLGLERRLAAIPPDRCLVIHAGFWTVNSGFSAWRTTTTVPDVKYRRRHKHRHTHIRMRTRKLHSDGGSEVGADAGAQEENVTMPTGVNCSTTLLAQWRKEHALFMRKHNGNLPYLTEQRGLLNVFDHNRHAVVQRLNGFLGWHMKGNARYKTALSTIARKYVRSVGPAVFVTCCMYALFLILCTCLVLVRKSLQQRANFVTSNVKVFYTITSLRAAVAFIAVAVVWDMATSLHDAVQRHPNSCAAVNFSHVLPDGRLMLSMSTRFGFLSSGDCTAETQPNWRFSLFKWLNATQERQAAVFRFAMALNWSRVGVILAVLCTFRLALEALFVRYRKDSLAQYLYKNNTADTNGSGTATKKKDAQASASDHKWSLTQVISRQLKRRN